MAADGRRRRRSHDNSLLILGLARGLTYAEAGQQAGVPAKTVFRRMQDPEFRRQVDEAKTELVARLAARYAAEGDATLAGLVELRDNAESEQVRLGALRTINEYLVKLREHADLQTQLDELRAKFEGAGP